MPDILKISKAKELVQIFHPDSDGIIVNIGFDKMHFKKGFQRPNLFKRLLRRINRISFRLASYFSMNDL